MRERWGRGNAGANFSLGRGVARQWNTLDHFKTAIDALSNLRRRKLPDKNQPIVPGRRKPARVGTKGNGFDHIRVSSKSLNTIACLHRPESNGAIIAGRRDPLQIRTKSDIINLMKMPLQRVDQCSAAGIPEFNLIRLIPNR
jgi:hypothetical protein